MKKGRAPDLTDELVNDIVEMLDVWKSKLTWDLLIAEIDRKAGILYSRYTLMERQRIADAFDLRKEVLRGSLPSAPSTPRDERLRAALEQVERYRAKATRLEQENQRLLEQFVTWLTNAHRKGVTVDALSAPLSKPDRERTPGNE